MVSFFERALAHTNLLFSWAISLAVIAVLVFPSYAVSRWAKKTGFVWRWALTGAAFGLIAIPLSLWLYLHYYVGPVRALIFGFPGLFMMMAHSALPEILALPFPAYHEVLNQSLRASTLVFPSLFWATLYAACGAAIDAWKLRSRSKKRI